MKSLAEYLAEYIEYESRKESSWRGTPNDIPTLKEQIKQGLEAYQSTENCTVAVCGGDCPECNDGTILVKKDTILFDGVDDVEVCAYKCPTCGYVIYG